MTTIPESVIRAGEEQYRFFAAALSSMVGLAFFGRIGIYLATGEGTQKYGRLVKETLIYFAIIASFPMFMNTLLETTANLGNRLLPHVDYSALLTAKSWSNFHGILGNVELFIKWIALVLAGIIGTVAGGLQKTLVAGLYAIAPIVIFSSTLLDLAFGLPLFLSALIIVCSWPVFANVLLGLAIKTLDSGGGPLSAIGELATFAIFAFCALGSPIALFLMATGVKPTKAFSGAKSALIGGYSGGKRAVNSAANGFATGAPTAMAQTGASALARGYTGATTFPRRMSVGTKNAAGNFVGAASVGLDGFIQSLRTPPKGDGKIERVLDKGNVFKHVEQGLAAYKSERRTPGQARGYKNGY